MSHGFVDKILQQRADFIKHLKEDLSKNDKTLESVAERVASLKITSENVSELGKKVEHRSLIPLGKKIYVNGTITHTGEYFLDKLSFPDSYSVAATLDDTLKHLESKTKNLSEQLRTGEAAKEQLLERIRLLQGDEDSEIVTDKGVAIKVGEFYEILEFEN